MKMASTSIDLIRKKKNKFARAADFFVFRCRCFARLQCRFVRLKVMLHRTIFGATQSCNVVVANRLV